MKIQKAWPDAAAREGAIMAKAKGWRLPEKPLDQQERCPK